MTGPPCVSREVTLKEKLVNILIVENTPAGMNGFPTPGQDKSSQPIILRHNKVAAFHMIDQGHVNRVMPLSNLLHLAVIRGQFMIFIQIIYKGKLPAPGHAFKCMADGNRTGIGINPDRRPAPDRLWLI